MLTLFASLAFAAAAFVAFAAMRATWVEFRDLALGNVAALGHVGDQREFRVSVASLERKPIVVTHPSLRRAPQRAQAARTGFRPAAGRRAAA